MLSATLQLQRTHQKHRQEKRVYPIRITENISLFVLATRKLRDEFSSYFTCFLPQIIFLSVFNFFLSCLKSLKERRKRRKERDGLKGRKSYSGR